METKEVFSFLVETIHSTVFATADENGLPHTCVIDLMLCDDDSLYFLTARGKSFYERLCRQPYVSLSGMHGSDTLSIAAVSVRGKVRELGNGLVEKVFAKNPYMQKIYPTPAARKMLTVFQIYAGEGEYFDMRQLPPRRARFSFGGAPLAQIGYRILPHCTCCGDCAAICPSACISATTPYSIRQENCIHCGACRMVCPQAAVERL